MGEMAPPADLPPGPLPLPLTPSDRAERRRRLAAIRRRIRSGEYRRPVADVVRAVLEEIGSG
jgi:hypothetical protein